MATDLTDDGGSKKTIHDMDTNELFSHFTEKAVGVKEITDAFDLLKDKLNLQGKYGRELYDDLKSKLTSWKAKSLWEIIDKKTKLSEYSSSKTQPACSGTSVVIVGCGPVGMRLAIECSLLGCDVIIVEKRQYFSRNNVLHLWPFVIDDLKRLGAKKFYGSFCAGAIDHISIRTLQYILLKVSLIVGVKIYFNVEFVKILEPEGRRGWHGEFNPPNHEINLKDFRILVGAEGKTSRIPGFDRKELRAKLALAITANFVNHHTAAEAAVQEISGVAFIFNQKFFKDLKEDTGIDLENLVYYKDDTHYFIMTAKKDSLLDKGVLRKDFNDVNDLLHPSNRDVQKLYEYACEAADWSTELPHLDFAVNHKNQPDVDLFDFTSIYQAEYAAKCIRREEKDLLLCLVGDSLVQPFWPQGTGCARGFLSAMDAAWMIRGVGLNKNMLELLAERESLFQRLTQTKPESLVKKFSAYTIDPKTRYPNLHLTVKSMNVKHLYDFDGAEPLELVEPVPKQKENYPVTGSAKNIPTGSSSKSQSPHHSASPTKSLSSINKQGKVNRALYGTIEDLTQVVDRDVLLQWFRHQVKDYNGVHVHDLYRSFRSGLVLCTVIHRYNPEFIPDYYSLTSANPMDNNSIAFTLAENHYGIQKLLKPSEMDKPDRLALFTYLSNFYAVFKELDLPEKQPAASIKSTPPAKPPRRSSQGRSSHYQKMLMTPPSAERSWNTRASTTRKQFRTTKKEKKKEKEAKKGESKTVVEEVVPTVTKSGIKNDKKINISVSSSKVDIEDKKKLSVETSVRSKSISNVSVTASTSSTSNKGAVSTSSTSNKGAVAPAKKKTGGVPGANRPISTFGNPSVTSDICFFCNKKVYLMERMSANGVFFHRHCFRCSHCNTQLNLGHFAMSKGENGEPGKFFCKPHYRQLFLSNPEAINYARSQPQRKTPESESSVSPPTSPLAPIGEYDVISTPKSTTEDEEEAEISTERKIRRRTLTQRVSSFFRRSRKSTSPEKHIPEPDEDSPKSKLTEKEPTSLQSTSLQSTSLQSKDHSPDPIDSIVPTITLSSENNEVQTEPFRERSPPVISRAAGITPPPGVATFSTLSARRTKRRGQKSVVRAMMVPDEEDEIAMEERQKQQERFREAQSIQREMSQIELQYEELEEIARDVEQNLRDSEETEQEEAFMKAWLNLIAERNVLVRRTQELSLQMKVLELEDRQYELEKTIRELGADMDGTTADPHFDRLVNELVEVIEERDNIVQQVEQDRLREQEEETAQTDMLCTVFGLEQDTPSRSNSSGKRRTVESKKRSSWW